jgi:G:T-mismatch repair DNA endonuclease (very short patch repair protein)
MKHWNNLSDEEKYLLIKKRCNIFISKLETRISTILSKLNISHQIQYWVNKKPFDIFINNTNILIEVNGDFWHGNPLLYNENDVINHPFKKVKAKDLWNKDNQKIEGANKKGYVVITIWEKEIIENKKNLIDFVLNKLDINNH